MVHIKELSDAWMAHWLGCTQSKIIDMFCNKMRIINWKCVYKYSTCF